MSYIGNQPTNVAFQTDTFSGTGSQTAFTMSVAPANTTSVLVAITGVLQDPSTYSVSGTTLTFTAAPPSGTSNISVRYLGIPASGVTTTAYRTVTNFTATAGQTSFTTPSYTVGYIDVFRNGVYLPTTDYTATTGTTVVLNNAATVGDTITTSSFFVSSVLNALPTTGGTLSGNLVVSGDLTTTGNTVLGDASTDTLNVGNGGLVKDASGNVGIGTSSPLSASGLTVSKNSFSVTTSDNNFGTGGKRTFVDMDSANNVGRMGALSGGVASGTALAFFYGAVTTGSASEGMRIDTSGNLLVGRTTNPGGLSSSLYVTGAYSNTTPSGANVFVNTDGSFYRSTSSLKYKTDIQNYSRGLEDIAKLRAVFYKAKSGISTEQRFAGFIAEEIQAAGLTEFVQYNENNEPDALSYGNMVALCVKAIQEQQALINQLQADVAALKGTP